jgi:leader peptidase (prepilin peptidase)/N-methyltransferase
MMGRLFYKKEGMGLGDVKLMVMAGIFMGFQNTAVALLFAVWIAAIGGVIILRFREEKSDHYMAFGPFLAAACVLSQFFGTQIANWYISLLFKV